MRHILPGVLVVARPKLDSEFLVEVKERGHCNTNVKFLMDQRSALQKRIPNPAPQSFVRKEKLAKLAFYFPRGPASFVILEGQDSIATLSVARQVHIHSRVVAVGGASYVGDLHVHLVKFSEGSVPKEHNQVLEP